MNSNLFLFTGEETYLLREQVNSWKKAFLEKHGDINLEMIDGQEKPLNEIMASVAAMPFLGEKRLLFIEGLPDAPKTRAPDKVTKKDEKRDEELKKMLENLDDIPDTSVVVFVQAKPDKRRAFYKGLSKKATIKTFDPIQGKALISWLTQYTKKLGASISYETAEYLISQCGHNLWRLVQELSKLTSFKPGEAISRENIDLLVVPTLEANIFHLTDALGARNYKGAIHQLHRSMAAGESLRPAFYMIVRQFRLLIRTSGYLVQRPNAPSATIASALKIHPFVAKNTLEQVKHFKVDELKAAYKILLEIDTGLKTSKIRVTTEDQDELALAIERFILKFCG